MGLETATYVGGLNASNPATTDPKSQGDDHLRLLKSVLLNSFAGFSGMILVTGTEAQGATANDYTLTISPAPAAYTSPMVVMFKATHANTGAATVQIGALGTKPLLAVDGSALKAGDIENGGLVAVFYDGTSFFLLSGNDRADRNGDSYSGTHDYTGATLNVSTPTASAQAVNKAYADGLSFSTALPAQTGNGGKFVTTNGSVASWGTPGLVLAPLAGGAFAAGALNGVLVNASYTLPDLTTTTDAFGLCALTNASSVPASVTCSDSWTISTGFSAGTLSILYPFSKYTAHGTWGGGTMAPPTLATAAAASAPTIVASVQVSANVLVVFFTDSAGLKAVAFDTSAGTVGNVLTVQATATAITKVVAYNDAAGYLVASYVFNTNASRLAALTISGTTLALSAGSPYTVSATALDAPTVQLAAGSYVTSIGAAVTAHTCTAGTFASGTATAAAFAGGVYGLRKVSSTLAVIAGATANAAGTTATARTISVTGTSAVLNTAAVSATSIVDGRTNANSGFVPFDAANFLLWAKDTTTSTTSNFWAVAISGTACSFGAVTTSANNNPSTYTPVTYAYAPGQQVIPYSATQVLFGNLAGGPYVVSLSGTAITVGATQLSGQTAGTFYRDFAAATWFYVGSSAFDIFTVGATTTMTSSEQVAVAPSAFFTSTLNNKAVKYSGSWYAWTVTLTMPATASKSITISGSNLLLQGSIT